MSANCWALILGADALVKPGRVGVRIRWTPKEVEVAGSIHLLLVAALSSSSSSSSSEDVEESSSSSSEDAESS